ncbi:BtrH N-terminal domain-containing protein [Streptomyces sp. NRRL S-475]|uniref:BtrH N-terminal domain-containing protein n=1 Tax=Streptomyces sp. NRRL S-475 TaxID=1463910 RepID=UPI00099810CE|nr:BtrH N-terminal domain-containing protein [Streptomyces sp. NRRL S-475]
MRLATFQPQLGVHCETTTLRNMLHHAGAGISEAMLFGLGQGIDFQYRDAPDPGHATPMLTGRIEPALLSRNACAALGATLRESRSPDSESASAAVTELLAAGHVVGVSVDIFHLDYFSSRSHFASHYIAVYGLDDSLAHVVDTEQQGGAQTLTAQSLRRARASDEGFMPSPHLCLYVEKLPERLTTDTDAVLREQIWHAIRQTAQRMTEDRGPRFGLRAMRRAASEIAGWGDTLACPDETVPGVGRFWRFAGTGGANFRKLYAAFLREARQRYDDPELDPFVQDFDDVRRQWDQAIDLLTAYRRADGGQRRLEAAAALLDAIADAEQALFERLLVSAAKRAGEPV